MNKNIPPPQPGDSMWVKPKIRNRRAIANVYGCLLGVAMLLSGLIAGIFGTYLFAPALYGWSVTQTAIWQELNQTARADAIWYGTQNAALVETADAQALTADALRLQGMDNDSRATEIVMMMNMTQADLNNELSLLESTATRSAANVIATRTADAVNNSRQMTQIAMDYSATQSSLQQNATQVELDFQQTQASINQNATEISDDNASSQVDSVQVVAQAVVPTETPAPAATNTIPPTLTPATTIRQISDLTDLKRSRDVDWREDSDTGELQSLVDGAWLMSEKRYQGDYELSFAFLPAYQPQPEYLILINVPESGNAMVVRLQADGLQLRNVGLYQMPVELLTPPVNVSPDDLRELTQQAASMRLIGNNQLRVTWQDTTLTVSINEEVVLRGNISIQPAPGTVGILVPAGVQFSDVSFSGTPEN